MARFSLITGTVGRTDEFEVMLTALVQQEFKDYELIVVDQNPDNRLDSVLERFSAEIPIQRVMITKGGASKARNAGLALVTGEIVAFPDDDCWYLPDLLGKVDAWFRAHPEYAIYSVGAVDEEGIPSGNRWVQAACDLAPINIFRTTFASSLFMKAESLDGVRFDEELGTGCRTRFQSGEETDLVLCSMAKGFKGRYESRPAVCHPRRDLLSNTASNARAVTYGAGMGRVLRKHSLVLLWISLATYDVLRATLVVLRGRFGAAMLCLSHGWGVVSGFLPSVPAGKRTPAVSNTLLFSEQTGSSPAQMADAEKGGA